MIEEKIKQAIRDIPDFPKPGIMFKDITPLLKEPRLCRDAIIALMEANNGVKIDAVAGIESRGFLLGLPLAIEMNVPFIPIRKKGKLPHSTVDLEYDLEYGSATIEMHQDAIEKDWNVLIHDDLLATGGTACASARLIQKCGGNVAGFSFIVDLTFLKGEEKLTPFSQNIVSLARY